MTIFSFAKIQTQTETMLELVAAYAEVVSDKVYVIVPGEDIRQNGKYSLRDPAGRFEFFIDDLGNTIKLIAKRLSDNQLFPVQLSCIDRHIRGPYQIFIGAYHDA